MFGIGQTKDRQWQCFVASARTLTSVSDPPSTGPRRLAKRVAFLSKVGSIFFFLLFISHAIFVITIGRSMINS